MARPVSEKVGRGKCPECGEAVTFRRSSGGLLTHRCDNCDSTGYAEAGGLAFKKRMATIEQTQEPEPSPKPPTKTPAKPAANSPFSMDSL